MNCYLFWRSICLEAVFFHRYVTLQKTEGEKYTLPLAAPSMRHKVLSFCDFWKVNMLNIRRLILAVCGAVNPSLSASTPKVFENQCFGLIFVKSLRQVCANVKPSFHSAKKMKG